jgi:nucleoside 2-deoxyribosyltransferase
MKAGWFSEDLWLLSCVVYNASQTGRVLLLTTETIPEIVKNAPKPSSLLSVADDVLLDLIAKMRHGNVFAGPVRISGEERRRFYLQNPDDLLAGLRALERRGFVHSVGHDGSVTPTFSCEVTIDGWERAEQVERGAIDSRQVFVAMSFNPDLVPAYKDAIAPAIIETGFVPFRSDLVHYNTKIDDRIVAELKRSAFVVADFTEHKGGVYFEAGFALGRGREVIWCCRDDDVKNAHFDTRQYNHIPWESIADLRTRLADRIRATIPSWSPRNELNRPDS